MAVLRGNRFSEIYGGVGIVSELPTLQPRLEDQGAHYGMITVRRPDWLRCQARAISASGTRSVSI